jgi:chromosome segregation ATPase
MELITYLEKVVTTCSRIIKFGASMQSVARNKLIDNLQKICSNVESAYSDVLSRLRSVKENFNEPKKLAKELRDFAADKETRDSFKPDKLCGGVYNLISDFESNLNPLKYSVDVRKLGALKNEFNMIGNVDAALYDAYDEFARDLDKIATEISSLIEKNSSKRLKERTEYAQHLILDFEDELFDAIKKMREAKDRILR